MKHLFLLLGKDNVTYWKKHPPATKAVKTRSENLIKRLPGSSMATRSLKKPIEIWNYFFNEEILNIIVHSTNKYIQSVSDNYARPRDAKPTDIVEIRALFGLLYMAGVSHVNRQNRDDIWKRNGYGIEIFHLTMSEQRFKFLLRCIRFDDKDTRMERTAFDKLAAIRAIFDIFVTNCKNGYCLSAYVTIDEMLAGFRGKCNFRQYIPSKPNKYGIKILAMCDAKMFYTSIMEVYVGKQPDGPYKISNSSYDVVTRLCQHILGTGRNVTIDNWFTSLPLVKTLLSDFKLTVIGTIRKNKRELPVEFSKPVSRPEKSSMFGFRNECTLVSYIPKKGKNVLLVSSLHHSDDINNETGDLQKPEMVTEYNKTKGGVDVVDKLVSSYDCARNTRRWPMVIFYTMLNVAGINAQVIFTSNNPETKILRRNFLRELADNLIRPYLQRRVSLTNIPRSLQIRLKEVCGIENDNQENVIPGRCSYCGWKKNRKTRFSCFQCNTYMCLEHITAICSTCKENAFQNK